MMETYLGGEDDPLDGFEFLTMAEAGEVGHWSIVGKLNERAGDARVASSWTGRSRSSSATSSDVLDGSLQLAADEDPNEVED